MTEAMAAFFGAFVGVGVMVIRDWVANSIAERQRAIYLAIRVVNALDPFVDDCAAVCQDNGYLGPATERGEADTTTEAPNAPRFPNDLDWRSIDHRLTFDILSLENKVSIAVKETAVASDNAFPPDYGEYFSIRSRAYTVLGLEAARIARNLRDIHDLPRRTFSGWNPEEILAEAKWNHDRKDLLEGQ